MIFIFLAISSLESSHFTMPSGYLIYILDLYKRQGFLCNDIQPKNIIFAYFGYQFDMIFCWKIIENL